MTFTSPQQQGGIFVDETVRAFSFLQDECGYSDPIIRQSHQGMSSDFTEVRYESDSIYLTIFYAHMESELSISMGLRKAKRNFDEYRQRFRMEEDLNFLGKDAASPISYHHPRLESRLRDTVDALSMIVRNNLLDALCNPEIIQQWVERRNS
ncbi:MAG: hypothetical protein ACYC27_17970 [Armatimonadota bacterium]